MIESNIPWEQLTVEMVFDGYSPHRQVNPVRFSVVGSDVFRFETIDSAAFSPSFVPLRFACLVRLTFPDASSRLGPCC